MMRLLACLITSGSLLLSAASGKSWREIYMGMGSAQSRSGACHDARDNAQANASAACQVQRGWREGSTYSACACSELDEGLHACSVRMSVRCERAER